MDNFSYEKTLRHIHWNAIFALAQITFQCIFLFAHMSTVTTKKNFSLGLRKKILKYYFDFLKGLSFEKIEEIIPSIGFASDLILSKES